MFIAAAVFVALAVLLYGYPWYLNRSGGRRWRARSSGPASGRRATRRHRIDAGAAKRLAAIRQGLCPLLAVGLLTLVR